MWLFGLLGFILRYKTLTMKALFCYSVGFHDSHHPRVLHPSDLSRGRVSLWAGCQRSFRELDLDRGEEEAKSCFILTKYEPRRGVLAKRRRGVRQWGGSLGNRPHPSYQLLEIRWRTRQRSAPGTDNLQERHAISRAIVLAHRNTLSLT